MKTFRIPLTVVFWICITSISFSQKNLISLNPQSEYQKGLELFNKEKYNVAQESFYKTIEAISNIHSEMRISAEYYAAICAVELFNNDAEAQLTSFISNHPENAKIKYAYFQLGKLLYRQKKYKDALKSFENIDIYNLSAEEQAEYYFKSGYAYFMIKENEKAKKQFIEVIDIDTKYFTTANYFYAHICYTDKNYEPALACFKKIEKDENFGPVVPYYIAQIYYMQGKYADVITYASALQDSANTKRADEIARILGDSYFKTENYSASIPFLEKYLEKTANKITREDYYEIGFAYYKAGSNYTKASEYLSKVVTAEDSLTQCSYHILGDCYIKSGNKKFAMNAFQSAYKLSFYPYIKEEALYNYAKLAYELAINPYNEAITSFQTYINEYPNSPNIDEARTYLVNIFLTTKNYKDALASIENMKRRDDKMNQAYQKVAFYRGIELFNSKEKDIDGAIALFKKSNSKPIDKTIKAQCYYWIGEGYYRKSDFDSAKIFYEDFQVMPGAYSLPVYNMANYNIAYCHFKQKKYKSAINDFRKFVNDKSKESARIINDAYLRIGDCYYISKEYSNAVDYYDKSIDLKSNDMDYALYQKSLCLGAQGKYAAKAAALKDMLDKYPKTAYADDATYELANTYLIMNNNDDALLYFNKVIQECPNYAEKALLKVGVIYRNTNKDDLSLTTLKKVVTTYPSTETSKSAIETIRNIYVDMDSVPAFYRWVKSLPFAYGGSQTEQDSVTYEAAENQYSNGDCEKAIRSFNEYIKEFPNGYFITNVNYYKADCEYKSNNMEEALKGFAFVAAQSQNKFSEHAILKSAEICYKLNRYDSAAMYYEALESHAEYKSNIIEARSMIMRCYSKTGKNDKAVKAARALLATEKVSAETMAEAHATIARAALLQDSTALAQTEFELTFKQSPMSEFGAEAKYNLALIQYKLKNYTQSEKMIFEIINQVPSYDYWIAKSFILLADVYTQTDNVFQAKATLQSIIDNADIAELITIAHEKLNAINEAEKAKELEEQKKQEEIKINFDNNAKDEKLFEENNQTEEEKTNE